jgi:hypothetical protein
MKKVEKLPRPGSSKGITMILPWYYHDITMILPWYFMDVFWVVYG